jgi:Flp pilus assembly protein TadD
VKFRQGEVADAVNTLETAVQMVPEDPDVNTHLGDAYAAVGRSLEARYQWQFALSLNPTAEEAARLRAKLASVEAVSQAQPVKP